jgi:hypothetical protein
MFSAKDVKDRAGEMARNLLEDYADKVKLGDMDSDEALQSAISWTLREYRDEVQADVYALLSSQWQHETTRFVHAERVIHATLLAAQVNPAYRRG